MGGEDGEGGLNNVNCCDVTKEMKGYFIRANAGDGHGVALDTVVQVLGAQEEGA